MDDDMDYRNILLDIFPTRSSEYIDNIIQIVEDNIEDDELKLEEMINLLAESGESTLHNSSEEGAVGFGHEGYATHLNFLENMLPNVCPLFLRKICEEKLQNGNVDNFNEMVNELLEGNYVTRENIRDAIFDRLVEMIPDADPDYLREQSELYADKPALHLHEFIEDAVEKHEYPTKKDYFKRQKNINELKRYTDNFTVDDYLNAIPNPIEHFNSSYKSVLTENGLTEEDRTYAINNLLNLFPYLRMKDIKKVIEKSNNNIIQASDTLGRIPRHFRKPRERVDILADSENVKLLQELAYINHKAEIKLAIKMKNKLYRDARAEAEKYNLLETCQCCFFDGLLPEECYFCKKSCAFCKECVAKGAAHVIGKGELVFPCLSNCNSEFDVSVLKMVLDPKIFEPLFSKIQIEEVKKANIDGLETCPFCDFSMIILSNQEKVFKCQNTECMEESCRECRQKSHVPLRCNEIEYDEDVKKRTYIENKMTEALLRTCSKCRKSILKDSGCNKVTCPCGTTICYICGTSDINYAHFGEIRFNKCPLYTVNLNELHAKRVLASARQAKNDLGINMNPNLLKIDPTEGIEEYFQNL